MYFFKQDDIKILFLFFTIFSIILIIFNIYFPHEAFAMAPPQDIIIDYYGHKEYVGPDPYGYYHNPAKNISSYTTRYDNCNNPDYIVSDVESETRYELDGKSVYKSTNTRYELDGKPVYKSANTPYDKDELHF